MLSEEVLYEAAEIAHLAEAEKRPQRCYDVERSANRRGARRRLAQRRRGRQPPMLALVEACPQAVPAVQCSQRLQQQCHHRARSDNFLCSFRRPILNS
jgi:hypothetical protein